MLWQNWLTTVRRTNNYRGGGKDVSESLIPINKTKNEATVDKRKEMQISGDAEDVELKGVEEC